MFDSCNLRCRPLARALVPLVARCAWRPHETRTGTRQRATRGVAAYGLRVSHHIQESMQHLTTTAARKAHWSHPQWRLPKIIHLQLPQADRTPPSGCQAAASERNERPRPGANQIHCLPQSQ